MKLTGLLLSFCFILCSSALFAQDLHFTLYDYAPLSINPANSGNYEGTYRIGGIYRDQWAAVNTSASSFRTPMVYIDAPLIAIGKRDWLGAGLAVQLDESGSLDQKTNTFMLSAAYHRSLNKKTTLSLGVQGGARNRDISNTDAYSTENMLLNNVSVADEALTIFETSQDPSSGFVVNAGLVLKSKVNKNTNFQMGISALNINQPNQSLEIPTSKDTQYKLPLRFNLHGSVESKLNDKWTINPTILVSNIRNQNELDLQVWGEYLLNKEKEIDLRVGLGHRLGRDIQPLFGVNYGSLRAAVGYDLRVGTLGSAISGRGGIEIAIGYTGTIFKKPDVPPVIFCPQL